MEFQAPRARRHSASCYTIWICMSVLCACRLRAAPALLPAPLRRGEILRLHVPLPGGSTSVPVASEVLWTQEEEGGFASGLQFLA